MLKIISEFIRAGAIVAIALTQVAPAGAQTLPATGNMCEDASKTPEAGVNESISGRPAASGTVSSADYVMIFPSNADTEKYITYLSSGGKVMTQPGESPEDTSARVLRDMQAQTAKLPAMLASMRMAMVDKHGNFQCGGLQPGRYIVVSPVTVMQSNAMFGGRSLPQSTFYTARATIPQVKSGSHGRLVAPTSAFSP